MNRLTFLVHKGKEYTVGNYLRSWGQDLPQRVRERIRVRHYPNLRSTGRSPWKRLSQELRSWRIGTISAQGPRVTGTGEVYVFADIERLAPTELTSATALYERLAENPDTVRLFNHPARCVLRFDLLTTLYREGINPFTMYRASADVEPRSWPVFLRPERDHGGHSPLLHTSEELARARAAARDRRGSLDGLLVSEFCDTIDDAGFYRKYAAFKAGERILARQLHFSRDWVLRFPDVRQPELAALEREFVETNPHEEELRKIFELAKIDYGRVDYTLRGDDLVIWEINTNPTILISRDRHDDPLRLAAQDAFGQRFNQLLEELIGP